MLSVYRRNYPGILESVVYNGILLDMASEFGDDVYK